MDNGAAIAMTLLVLPHLVGWLSLARLNGGRPGFPLYLHYTRPVRTAVIVGLPMAYLTAMSSAIYLVSALLLRVTSGYAFPLLPVAAWIAALTLVFVAAGWSTRDRTIPVLVMDVCHRVSLGCRPWIALPQWRSRAATTGLRVCGRRCSTSRAPTTRGSR